MMNFFPKTLMATSLSVALSSLPWQAMAGIIVSPPMLWVVWKTITYCILMPFHYQPTAGWPRGYITSTMVT